MKKVMVSLLMVFVLGSIVFAGGIVTNTNQSAQFVRTLNRNASTDVDAVYYNPAGIVKLEDGFHLSLSNQSIWQTKTVTNSTAVLNNDEFVGKVAAPLFPNFYAVYKTGKMAFSAGFMPIGGGGGADYEDGLPFIDLMLFSSLNSLGLIGIPAAGINPALAAYGTTTGYAYDDVYFSGSSIYYGGQVGGAYQINDMVSVALSARYVMVSNTYEGYVKGIGLATSSGNTIDMSALAPDLEVDATESGSGIAAIIGVNVTPMEDMNIGIRYESITKLEIESETTKDDVGMFNDAVNTNADMPALLALGVSYKPIDKLRTEMDINYYFNDGVDWDGKEEWVDSGIELGLAGEYSISDKLLASVGVLYGDMRAWSQYQSDMSYSLVSTTIGAGAAYKVSPQLVLNAGLMNTIYFEQEIGATTYAKTTFGFAIGADYSF